MNKTRTITTVAMYTALAVALDYISALIPFLQMPQGGNINLALIPIFLCSYQLGFAYGVSAGLLWWFVGFILGGNNWFLTLPQYLMDYIIPAIICGFAAALPKIGKVSNTYVGITVTMILKYLAHVLSGVYWWFPETTYAGSAESWIYSLSYNLYYNLATMIVCLIVVPLLIKRLGSSKFPFAK